MARLRITIITTAALIALAGLQLSSVAQQQPAGAQQPGGGRGGPGGGRGPGVGFGFGGPGGGFNSLLGLASNPGVQGELKATEKQKAAIKALGEKYDTRNRELRTEAGFGGPGGPGGFFGGGPGGGGPGGGGGGNGGQGGGGGNRGGGGQGGGNADDAAQGGNGGGQAGGGGQGGGGGGRQGGGRGNRPQLTPEQLEKMEEFREATTALRLSAEQSLGKILDKKQVVRLKQIQFQLDPAGPWIVLRDEMVEKLSLSEEQVEMLTEIRDGQRQKDRELRKTNRETMDAVMKKAAPDFAGFGRGNRGNRGNNGNAGNNGGGQNGNQGNRPQFDPAAFQKAREEMQRVMEIPEVKEERDKQRESQKAIENESYALISKNLYPRQRATLKSMAGPPFDRSVMGMGGPFGGRFGGGAPAKTGTAKGTTAVAKSNSDDEDAAPAATTAKPQPAPKAKAAATTPRRKTLRELRNGSDDE